MMSSCSIEHVHPRLSGLSIKGQRSSPLALPEAQVGEE